jgi:hypothetical protein
MIRGFEKVRTLRKIMELFFEYGRSEFDDVAEYDYQRGKTFELCWGARDMSQQPQLVGLIIPCRFDWLGEPERRTTSQHQPPSLEMSDQMP